MVERAVTREPRLVNRAFLTASSSILAFTEVARRPASLTRPNVTQGYDGNTRLLARAPPPMELSEPNQAWRVRVSCRAGAASGRRRAADGIRAPSGNRYGEDFLGQRRIVNSVGLPRLTGPVKSSGCPSADEALDQIVDVAERSGLAAVAVDGDRLALERLDDEVRHDPPVARVHARTIGVEDSRDFDLQVCWRW